MADDIEIANFLDELEQYYGVDKFRVNPVVAQAWSRCFRDCPIVTMRRAWGAFIKDSPKVMTLSDVLKYSLAIHGGTFKKKPDSDSGESLDAIRDWYRRQGMEKVHNEFVIDEKTGAKRRTSHWVRKNQVVEHNGKWIPKIDFVLDRLGLAEVNRALRDVVGNNPKWSDLVSRSGWIPEYRTRLDELVERAKLV